MTSLVTRYLLRENKAQHKLRSKVAYCLDTQKAQAVHVSRTPPASRRLALPASSPTSCVTEQQVCSSGHMTWDPPLLFGNFSVVARWFPGEAARVRTSTGFIGLDSPSNEASITMGFHGLGWLGGNGEGPHRYQHGIYADVARRASRAAHAPVGWIHSCSARQGHAGLYRAIWW